MRLVARQVQAKLESEYGIKAHIKDGSIGKDDEAVDTSSGADEKAPKGKKADKAKTTAQKEEKRMSEKMKRKVAFECAWAHLRACVACAIMYLCTACGGAGF